MYKIHNFYERIQYYGYRKTIHTLFRYLRQYGFYRMRTKFKKQKYKFVNRNHIGNVFQLRWVDPSNVNYTLSPRFGPHSAVFRIRGGTWDYERRRKISQSDMYQAFRTHFKEGVPWEDTDFYGRIIDEIDNGIVKWECSTESEFRDVCDKFDALYQSIENHGLLSMAELAETDIAEPQYPLHAHEICIAIGRDGTIFNDEGRHRMFIAKILDLDDVPVRVLVRHSKWQDIRDRIAASNDPISEYPELSEYRFHPDLQDLFDEEC